jgi:hypothetical protein
MRGQVHTAVALPSGRRVPGTRWIEGWVGPRVDSGSGGEEKNPAPPGNPSLTDDIPKLK